MWRRSFESDDCSLFYNDVEGNMHKDREWDCSFTDTQIDELGLLVRPRDQFKSRTLLSQYQST